MEEKIRELLKEYELCFSRSRNDIADEIYLHIINNLKQILKDEETNNS